MSVNTNDLVFKCSAFPPPCTMFYTACGYVHITQLQNSDYCAGSLLTYSKWPISIFNLNSPVHRNAPHAHIGTVSLQVCLTQFCKYPVNHQFPNFTTDYSRRSCCAPTVNNACLLGKGHMESHLTVRIYSWGHDIYLRKVARAFLIWKVAEKDPFGLCHLWNVNGSIDITTTTYNLRLGVFH